MSIARDAATILLKIKHQPAFAPTATDTGYRHNLQFQIS
jgi:hypothetical protein